MEIFFFSHSYNRYGGSIVYSPIGDLLEVQLMTTEWQLGFSPSSLLAKCDLQSPPDVGIVFEKYHKYLEKLPKITFHRKLGRVKIEFESKVRTAEDEESAVLPSKQRMRRCWNSRPFCRCLKSG